MRCFNQFFVKGMGVLFAAFPCMAWAAADKISACLEQGKAQFSAQQYQQAKTIFSKCVQQAPASVDAQLSLAGVLLTLDDLDGAEKAFKAALNGMTRTSPYLSYTYSMLGDIALKRQQNQTALDYYTQSLQSNVANVNSLVGKGVITEYQGDKKAAAEFYRSALAVEPLNIIARQRLVNLEPEFFSDAEILVALKQRYAIKPDVQELTEDMRRTFTDIHRAEQRRGTDYLRKKYTKVPTDYLVTLNQGSNFERDLLTLAGYNALQKHIGQDAIAVFRQLGVPVKDVFDLKDMKGNKLFKEDNTLTDSGFFAYTEALQNRKAFLIPGETLPPSPEKLNRLAAVADNLKRNGYMEISRRELKFIEKQTKCSEETLRSKLGMQMLAINKQQRRYFIPQDAKDAKQAIPYYYLMKEKAKYDKTVKVPTNTLAENYAYYGFSICDEDGNFVQ